MKRELLNTPETSLVELTEEHVAQVTGGSALNEFHVGKAIKFTGAASDDNGEVHNINMHTRSLF